MGVIQKALSVFKREIEKTYTDLCNIYILTDNEVDGIITGDSERLLYENVPCGLSFKNNDAAVQSDNSKVDDTLMIFLSNEYKIPINSIFVVRHENREYRLISSGNPSVYEMHQQIMLRFENYA